MNNMYTNNINNLGMCPKCKKYLTGILVKKKYDETMEKRVINDLTIPVPGVKLKQS